MMKIMENPIHKRLFGGKTHYFLETSIYIEITFEYVDTRKP